MAVVTRIGLQERNKTRGGQVEWATIALAVVIHGGWLGIVVSHRHVPWWVTVMLLAVVLAWHGSLQHEVVHGHPFGSKAANNALGSLPLSPRLPYRLYRRHHLAHHACKHLTDPDDDVESYYFTAEGWNRLPPVGQWIAIAHQTFVGRLLIGPLIEYLVVWSRQAREIRRGDRQLARWWILHLALVATIGTFVVVVAGMPLGTYLAGIYAGHGLSLVRSYCEHRWVADNAGRSAVVRSGWFFSLLFLNNNLHHAHHARPGVAWYRLPALADRLQSDQAAAAGAGLYRGYLHVARCYLLRPFDELVHPGHRVGGTSGTADSEGFG